MLGLYGTCED